jgi:hypothetical protein
LMQVKLVGFSFCDCVPFLGGQASKQLWAR